MKAFNQENIKVSLLANSDVFGLLSASVRQIMPGPIFSPFVFIFSEKFLLLRRSDVAIADLCH